jgi:hypothetical protein
MRGWGIKELDGIIENLDPRRWIPVADPSQGAVFAIFQPLPH